MEGNARIEQRPLRAAGVLRGFRRLGELVLFVAWPTHILVVSFGLGSRNLVDFRALRAGGALVLAGHSPYPPLPAGGALAQQCTSLVHGCFSYPAPAAWLMAPFAVLPYAWAAVLFYLVSILFIVAALYLLGVRDWRCYGLSFTMIPVVGSIAGGTFSPLLLLAVAAVWRWRHRTVPVALALGGAVAAKIFPWPFIVWLLATRRWRAAVGSVVVSLVLVLVSWATIGFSDFWQYPRMVSSLAQFWQWRAYSPLALGLALGLGLLAAKAISYLIGVTLLAGVGLADDERLAFSLTAAATLTLTPIVWLHYFVLLLIPLALASPRLSLIWWLPLSLQLPGMANGHLSRMVPTFICTGAVLWLAAGRLNGQQPGWEALRRIRRLRDRRGSRRCLLDQAA